MTWIPDSCTLPTEAQPLRVAEFDELFTSALRGVERISPGDLRLVLEPAAEADARELAAKETECCSFFSFTFAHIEDGGLVMEVGAPEAQRAIVDAVAAGLRRACRHESRDERAVDAQWRACPGGRRESADPALLRASGAAP